MKIQFDGKEIVIAGLNLNQLCKVEAKFGSLAKLKDTVSMELIRYLAFQVISPVYPGMTEEQIGEKLTMESVQEIAKVLNPSVNVGTDRPL